MKKVFCFGEILLRYSPDLNRQWIKEASMPGFIGGAEHNVAAALALWEIPVKYGTALPDHALGKEIVQELHHKNIDVSEILLQGNRIGTYYLPQGDDLKNASVIYDRYGSSFGELKPGMIDWNTAFKDCDWFHFSAISPALNETVAAVCKEALEAASAAGLTISVDLNYRSKLWQYGKQPVEVMSELVSYCDLVMGNVWAAESLLGIEAGIKDSRGKSQQDLVEAASESIERLQEKYLKARTFAYTFRLPESYWAVLQQDTEMIISNQFSIAEVMDKAGSGDCFMAGLIYGFKHQLSSPEVINFAVSAAVGKLYEVGDSTQQTVGLIKSRL